MHTLNAKLTYRCTNNCQFCFSSYLKETEISFANVMQAVESAYAQGGRSLVISGGEPTLLPERIMELIERANTLGYEQYTIQTNGIGLSEKNSLFYFLKDLATEKQLSISFSVHGPTRHIHDTISSQDGAFDSLMAAIENISAYTQSTIYTNSVICTLNINLLRDIASLLAKYRIQVMQFAVMHSDQKGALSVGLLQSARAVHTLAGFVEKNILRTEGIPYCLMYGLEECVGESYWPDKLDLFNTNDDYISNFDQLSSGMRKKASFCSQCMMNEICAGSWAEHYGELLKHVHPIC